MKRLSLALVAAAALVGPGCSTVFHRPHFVRIRPVSTPTADLGEPRKAARSAYYQSAVRAIGVRDYALALDLLQTARAQDPNDPAVINAFGVVYDKLGRFDLSARYYAQAAALDPESPVVKQNLAYSALLQGRALPVVSPGSPTQLAVAAAPTMAQVTAALLAPPASARPVAPSPAAQPRVIALAPASPELLGGPPAAKPPQIQVAQAQAPAVVAKPGITIAKAPAPTVVLAVAPNGALLTGRSLQIVDASGATGGAEGVRQQLASRGWSAPKSAVTVARAEMRTRIVYPEGGQAVAKALARTLTFPVELAACDDRCTSVSLIVGQDAAQHVRAHS